MRSNIRGFTLLPVLIVFLILGVVVLYLLKPSNFTSTDNPREMNIEPPISSLQPQPYEHQPTSEKDASEYKYYKTHISPDQNYQFTMFSDTGSGCYFEVLGLNNVKVDVSNVLDFSTIDCLTGVGTLYSKNYKGWMGDHDLLIEITPGELIIFNVKDLSKVVYEYDSKKYDTINELNNPNNHILLALKRGGQGIDYEDFTLINVSNNNIINNYSFGENNVNVFYDNTNSGYIFVVRNFQSQNNKEYVETTFFFVGDNNYQLKKVLQNKPMEVGGRGCGPVYVDSVRKGEIIIYTGGCYVVDEEYYTESGEAIILMLPEQL